MSFRVLVVASAVCAVLSVVSATQSLDPQYSSPIIVQSLQAHHADAAAPKPENPHPLPYPNNDDHAWVSQMHKLQHEIETHDKTLDVLNADLAKAKEHRAKLLRAQRLFHAMVSLHQSETVLSLIDKKVDSLKLKVKSIGDQADDIVRSRDDLKKQMQDAIAGDASKLADLKKKLEAKAEVLQALCSKRSEVAGIVGEWRSHVDSLRVAHGLPPRHGGSADSISLPELPKPPTEEEEAQEESQEEEDSKDAAAAEGNGDGSSSGSGSAEGKHAKEETIAVDSEPAAKTVQADDITVSEKDLEATRQGIHELLNVHLPKVSAALRDHVAKMTSFIQVTEERLNSNNA